jgi:hypothetical protein
MLLDCRFNLHLHAQSLQASCTGDSGAGWGEGIHMFGQWGFFDQPEPRMDSFRWMALIFRLFKPMRFFHFQLDEAAG